MNCFKKLTCGFWNVGIIDSPVKEVVFSVNQPKIRWMKHSSRSKFYADPFPIGEDEDNYYILAEEYSFFTEKGIIVKLTIDKTTFELKKRQVVIETSFHLSFPFIYGESIVPEQSKSGKLYSYTNGKEVCICDYPVIDPVILKQNGKIYLFGTMPCSDNKGRNTRLFWYEWNGEKFILKSESPVKEDIHSSRFAGAFFQIDNTLYRPAQDSEKLYGGQTRIMKVTVDEQGYKEEEIKVLNSHSSDKFNEGFHTFNIWRNVVIVDGFQNEYRPLLKPFFVLCRIYRKFKTSN